MAKVASDIFQTLPIEALAFPGGLGRKQKNTPARKNEDIIGQISSKRKTRRYFDPGGVIFYILCGLSRALMRPLEFAWLIRRVI